MSAGRRVDIARLRDTIDRHWDESVLGCLAEYVRIPNQSPLFDLDWERSGHMDRAVQLLANWARVQPIAGMLVQVRRLPARTPLLLVDVRGELPGSVLLYGHLDKQPEFPGWLPGLGAWQPVIKEGKLYGRGAADDGYALFSALSAIAALQAQHVPLPRCVVLIEASEESGSPDLPAHLEALGAELGQPGLVVCLDAECGNYDQLWCTTSLRGMIAGRLRVRILEEGVHSGMASGIVVTPFRVIQQLLARLENVESGELLLDDLYVEIPADRRRQVEHAARILGATIPLRFPFVPGARALSSDPVELLLNNTWRPTLTVTGADGFPPMHSAGNVLLPELVLKLSMRLPPTADAARAAGAMARALESDPPYATQVSFEPESAWSGWNAPQTADWLDESMMSASRQVYAGDVVYAGSGAGIPFMRTLTERFPQTQFFATGVLGPHSNAHGPNEFLHIDYAQRLTACVALVLADAVR